jgi:diguanylate cyclase (GGDEF)-like protein/PAS domain S-box-containing protein
MELPTSTESHPTPDILGELIDLSLPDQDLVGCLETVINRLRDVDAEASASQGSSSLTRATSIAGVQQLFQALKAKDAATAAHSLRTTLGCAIWSDRLRLGAEERDAIETAALLHDVGKLVVPARVLNKPGPLSDEERKLVELCRQVGFEIMRQKVALPSVLEIATLATSWYDGSRRADWSPRELPFGARMLAIIDAFDAMTTDQVYRQALSFEQAFTELKRCAGRQFDPQLVHHFCNLPSDDLQQWRQMIRRHATPGVPPSEDQTLYVPPARTIESILSPVELAHFQQQVLEHLPDGVVFVDRARRIVYWNRGASRLTGISTDEAYHARWSPGLVGMRDGRGVRLQESDCPVAYALNTGKQWFRRVFLRGHGADQTAVDVQVTPVTSPDGVIQGAALLMHDLSPELSLRERCVSLQQLITRDGLTQVANRTEFDRVHAQSVTNYGQQAVPYSLILADIDHFKEVNDTFGHQAGDEILKYFAKLLERTCRRGDLVARYGGEEFAVLCPGCDVTTATRRAELVRRDLASLQHHVLGGKQVTASFGVTALQPDDTPAKMLARADKALYEAKRSGRNTVCSIGRDAEGADSRAHAVNLGPPLAEQELIAQVPLPIAVEKLRGFVADHKAQIISIDETQLRLKIDALSIKRARRITDRRLDCYVDVHMEALEGEPRLNARGYLKNSSRTLLRVAIWTARGRDRRRANAVELARELLFCFRSYMMVNINEETPRADASLASSLQESRKPG